MVINWTKQAKESLAEIYSFLLPQTGVDKAKEIVMGIARMPRILTIFPNSGPVRETKTGKQYRQIIRKHYTIFYSIKGDVAYIHFVWDSRRYPQLLETLLSKA